MQIQAFWTQKQVVSAFLYEVLQWAFVREQAGIDEVLQALNQGLVLDSVTFRCFHRGPLTLAYKNHLKIPR